VILFDIAENIALALDADRCAVFLTESENEPRLKLAAHYSQVSQEDQSSSQRGSCVIEQSALLTVLCRQEQSTLKPETDASILQTLYKSLDASQTGPTLIQPLLRQKRTLGVLIIGNDHRQFSSHDERLAQNIAIQLSSAIDNINLYRALATQTHQLAELLRAHKVSNRQQKAVLENIAAGIIVSDPDDRIVIINTTAEQMLRVSRQQILGMRLEQMINPISIGPRIDWKEVTHSETPFQTVINLENMAIHVNSAPVVTSDGEFLGTVAILRDITQEMETEKARSDFVTVAAHGLRTPLTAIRGYTEALSGGMAGKVTETQYHFLRIIRDNVLRMANLTENLIAVSEIEKEFLKLDYEPTDLHLLVGDIVMSFRSQLEDRQLEMKLDLDPSLPLVEADPARIRQILDNLVSNAIKFTYPGGQITIGARSLQAAEAQRPTQCSIWVSDTGIGIPREEQVRIWERFHRPAGTSAKDAGGLGMGLSIVKSLTEAHGGRVWLESTPGAGSTFTVLLPIRRNQHIDQVVSYDSTNHDRR
jgi:PAS domain S-box-containing protein